MITITAEDLKKKLEKHAIWLSGNGPGFSGKGGERAMLCSVDLRGMNFSGMDLRKVDFGGSDLRGTIFRGSDLRDSYFGGTDLFNADFRDANLLGADMRVLNLIGAILPPTDNFLVTPWGYMHIRADFIHVDAFSYPVSIWAGMSEHETDAMLPGFKSWWGNHKDMVLAAASYCAKQENTDVV